MRTKTLTGMLALAAMAVVISSSLAFAGDADGGNGSVAIGPMTFKTSPNVYVAYSSDSGTLGDGTGSTYVAGSGHIAGDRAYGVDPDYTGMYVQTVAVGAVADGSAMAGLIPAATAGSSGDFASGWSAK